MRRTLVILLMAAGAAHAGDYVYVIPVPPGQGLPPAYYTDPAYPKLPRGVQPPVAPAGPSIGMTVLDQANEMLRREMAQPPINSPDPKPTAVPAGRPCDEPASRRCL